MLEKLCGSLKSTRKGAYSPAIINSARWPYKTKWFLKKIILNSVST